MKQKPKSKTRPAPAPFFGDQDYYLFNEGTHDRVFERFGAHPCVQEEVTGTHFAVWAPAAREVSVIGDFNGWSKGETRLEPGGSSGIWQGFVAGVAKGAVYKYHVVSSDGRYRVDKADPVGFLHEAPPRTGSIVWELDYEWNDGDWVAERRARHDLAAPMSIYEVHLGSWARNVEEGDRPLSYRELAPRLGDHVEKLGFTHVEFLPVMEHPFYGSWGYQVTGYFAPSHRYGTPQDFMFLVDHLHQRGIGVILDWVPAHFPTDEHGLGYFDGTHLYEHEDPRQGFHPDWKSFTFNYGRNEVKSFLTSSARFWLEKYHADGLRVDGVASMLYLDYSREPGEWIPNQYGGREDLDAIAFLRHLNETIYREHPDTQTIAEESTAWPMVSRPTYVGGLGFGLKWDMGWMHDTLDFMSRDPIHRKHHHHQLTFRALYQFNENFVLPLSHDEVVHGKGSLLGKMPGDEWQKFANLRLLLAYMFVQPGKKLLFQGSEFAQVSEWNHDRSLDWHLLESPNHRAIQSLVGRLNEIYRHEKALHLDADPQGFEWIDASDWEGNIVSFERRHPEQGESLTCVLNFTPVVRRNYRLGVPQDGMWRELLNTDGREYEGGGQGNLGTVEASPVPSHGRPFSLNLTIPPLAALYLKAENR